MKNTSIRKIGIRKTKTKKGGYYYQGFTFVLNNIFKFLFITMMFAQLQFIYKIFIVEYKTIIANKNKKDIYKIFGELYENYLFVKMHKNIYLYLFIKTDFVECIENLFRNPNPNHKMNSHRKNVFSAYNLIFIPTYLISIGILGNIAINNKNANLSNIFTYFKNPFQKKIVKTITDVAQNKNIAVNEVKQLFPNEPNINAVKTITDAKELLTDKIEEATETLIANQSSSTIINQKDIEMLKSSNLTQNAEDFLKTSKPTSIIDKITNSINSTNELYLQLKNNTIETKTYIANFITKQKENIQQIKTDILAFGKSANSTIYEKTIGSLTKLFVLPTIDNLQDVFKNPNPEKITKMLGTIFVLLSATYILTKLSIEMYKWLFGIKTEEKKIDLSKLSTEEKEIIKNNEEKLKKLEKELLEKVAKGQKISTSKKTSSKSKSKSKK